MTFQFALLPLLAAWAVGCAPPARVPFDAPPAPKHDIEYPFDRNVYLFKGRSENIVAWLPAAELSESTWAPCTFRYGRKQLTPEEIEAGAAAPDMDEAVYRFLIRGATASRGFGFEVKLGFETGSFETVQ